MDEVNGNGGLFMRRWPPVVIVSANCPYYVTMPCSYSISVPCCFGVTVECSCCVAVAYLFTV